MTLGRRIISARAWMAAALVAGLLTGAFYWSRVDARDMRVPGGDTTVFVLLARSIRDHGQMRSTWTAGEPLHGKALPGFPLLLMPFLTETGVHAGAVRALIVLVTAAALFLVFILFRSRGSATALAVSFLSGQSLWMYLYGRSMLSEIPYLFLSLIVLVWWQRYERSGCCDRRDEAGIALMLALAFLMRAVAGILIMAVLFRLFIVVKGNFHEISRRRFLLWGMMALVAVWVSWLAFSAGTSQQTYWFELVHGSASPVNFAERWVRGVYALVFYLIPGALMNVHFTERTWLAPMVTLVFGWGLLKALYYERRVVDIYTAIFLVMAAAWPWIHTAGPRYLTPFVPFFLYYAWQGVASLAETAGRQRRWLKLFVVAIGAAVICCFMLRGPFFKGLMPGTDASVAGQQARQDGLYAWVRSNIPSDDLVVSMDPSALFFQTARRAPDYDAPAMTLQRFASLFMTGQALWCVDDERLGASRAFVRPLVERQGPHLNEVYRTGPFVVYHWDEGRP